MDELFKTTSNSPDSIFSEFSSHDTVANPATGSSLPPMSLYSPLRPSATWTDLSDVSNTLEQQPSFFDQFNAQRSSGISRWQSDAEHLNLNFNSSNRQTASTTSYLIDDILTDRNHTPSSITDAFISRMSRLSTSSSMMSFNSVPSQKPTSQLSPWSTLTNSSDQLIIPSENINPYHSTSSFLPLTAPSLHRQTLSAIGNVQSAPTYGNAPMAHSHGQPQPQVIYNGTRSNSMPSWRGYLPKKFELMNVDQYQHFSQKVFLGGIPPELSEAELLLVLRKFGKCNIKWPKNDGIDNNMPGFCHVVFRESRSVYELLKHCTRQQRSTIDYFLHIHMSPSTTSSRANRLKPIQVVPWNMKENVFVVHQENISNDETSYKDWSRTIFVSPLHGKMTGFSLATIMANVFGPVSMAQINTDKYGYPTGTGTVLFCDCHSYMRAVASGAIDIKCDCFHKLLDIDPFLRENEPCAFCPSVADLFCRNFHCLRSYCKQCWVNKHGPKPLADHQPATRRQQPLPHI